MGLSVDDGGYKSRKWIAYLITSGLIILTGKIIPEAVIGEVIMGLISCLGIYSGVNGFRDWVAMRSGSKISPTTDQGLKLPSKKEKKADKEKPPAEESEEEGS